VIEAGIDTSSDFFVTEIAPANSLIQRLGRFLRYREDHGKIVIWYETDEKGMLKIRTFPNREPKNWILVDAHCDEVYELCRTILGQKYDNKNIVKLSEWRGKTDHVAIARPLYKVYDYELVSRTLEWLKQNVDRLKVHIPETKDGRGYKELLNDVYNIDFFKVDKERVKELERIHDHLEGPTKAIEVLLDLEGSFIREGNIINVVPNRFATEFVGKKVSEAGEFIRRYCVPVSPSVLEIWKEKLLGILYIDDEGRIERKSADRIDIQDPKTVLDPTIIAFIIDAHYDDELGLVIE
jgi:CRISPR-associated endonuclease/helicase Cas3